MSSLDINFFFKGYVAFMPMQAIVLLYMLYYMRWGKKRSARGSDINLGEPLQKLNFDSSDLGFMPKK